MTELILPAAADAAEHNTKLLAILDGLIPLHLLQLRQPGELARSHARAAELADFIASSGDHITAVGNFSGRDASRTRAKVLDAMATVLAMGALKPGGVTWAGRHWCSAPHAGCPRSPRASVRPRLPHPDGGTGGIR